MLRKVNYEENIYKVSIYSFLSFKLYTKNRTFPKDKTYSDAALYCRMKVLSWITYDNL